MPAWGEQPVKSAPKKKAQERAKAAGQAAAAAELVPESRILMGVIGRPHGVRGLVRVTSYADDLTAYGPLTRCERAGASCCAGAAQGVAEIAELVGGAEVKVADRATAETLTNTRLYVDRAQLPEPEEDEFYLADLIGLHACDADGARLGTVSAVHDYGAGASLEIEPEGAPPLLVPFTRACVPQVGIAGGPAGVAASDDRRPAGWTPPCECRARRQVERDGLARLRADAVPGDVPRPAGAFPRRPRAAVGHLVAARRQHPRLRHRPPSHGGRHAVRRRRRHGAAARRGGCRHRLGRR